MAARTSILKLGQTEKQCMCYPYWKKNEVLGLMLSVDTGDKTKKNYVLIVQCDKYTKNRGINTPKTEGPLHL